MGTTVKSKWQFSLKTYLLLMALAAMMIGWWCDRQRLQAQLNDARRRIQLLETAPFYDVMPGVELRR